MSYLIHNANIKEWAKNYNGPLFDGILCDPPYELGFMGKSWDSTGIAFDSEMWADIYKLLKPGAHLLAFSGSRTYHRMAVAIEDAGFEIRDQLIWMYGSGFPKSLNISKALDKSLGETRSRIKVPEAARDSVDYGKFSGEIDDDNPITEEATYWNGYGTALKPAHEPCVLARKPLEGTVANNVLKHGTGGLNIDGSRVAGDMGADRALGKPRIDTDKYGKANSTLNPQSPLGRFPANLIHDGSDEVVGLFPNTGSSKFSKQTRSRKGFMLSGSEDNVQEANAPDNYGDSGSAARFFYCAKASKSERNAGLEDMPLIHPGEVTGRKAGSAGAQNGGYAGMTETPRQNVHPTVKPLSLTKYLATLIKPPTGGRLLVPFSGSGSEMIGALQAGWEEVIGVELTEEYIPIAEARIKHWIKEPVQESLL